MGAWQSTGEFPPYNPHWKDEPQKSWGDEGNINDDDLGPLPRDYNSQQLPGNENHEYTKCPQNK